MRSRLFHRPLLHSPEPGTEKRAGWIELFFDLLFVTVFIQLGEGLSTHTTGANAAAFAGIALQLWVVWTGSSFFENRYTVNDLAHRALIFLHMFTVVIMAVTVADVFEGHVVGFSLSAGAALWVVAIMYARVHERLPNARAYSRLWGMLFFLSGTLWMLAALLPLFYAVFMWALGTIIILWAPLNRYSRSFTAEFPLDFKHLGERFALLTLIVLGASFLKVITTIANNSTGLSLYLETGAILLLVCSVWWIYFDDVAGAPIRTGPGRWIVWLYAHAPLQAGIIVLGVAITRAVHFTWLQPAPESARWLLSCAIATIFFSVAAVDSVTERRQTELSDNARVNARWISATVILVLAPAGSGMSGGLFLALVVAIAVAQIIFDVMMAPFEEAEYTEHKRQPLGALSDSTDKKRVPNASQRRDVSETVRKGTPANLRRDLYFYFIEGSWTRVFAAFSFVFALANVFFAGLYMLEAGSVHNAENFADAFFFSVQTMSTIGYGTLTPATPYGHAIVAVEAALSVIGVAFVTGLSFAKVSRAKANVLFSKPMVLTRMNNKPVLMFRVGNARGNEVVDATMTVNTLTDEVTPEGHHVRRLQEVKLTRRHSPMFVLSWSVVHEIDDNSPLATIDWKNICNTETCSLMGIVVTLIGHDGTYGQTVYARHMYYPEDIRVGERFVDVLSQLEDGRLMLDYTLFHDTVPDSTWPL